VDDFQIQVTDQPAETDWQWLEGGQEVVSFEARTSINR
jgi:hypothetical protein